jgi:hypothetical protein
VSRITNIPVRHDRRGYLVTVGWDPPLRTFYGQVYDADTDEWAPPVRAVGTAERIDSVDGLAEALGYPFSVPVEQDAELRATLEEHRELNDARTVMRWGIGPWS